MERILSQEEIDALLSAVDRGEIKVPDARTPAPLRNPGVRYDFRKPNRVSKDQTRKLHSIHETFARQWAASLTAQLRGPVEIELKSVEQITYGQFVTALASPTCLVVFNMEPLEGSAALEIHPNLLFRLIDRLLGGSGLMSVRVREFTEVEQVLIERVATRALGDLQQAWAHAGTFNLRVDRLETNPTFVQLTAPGEISIVVTLEMTLGEETGPVTLMFPYLLVEPVMPKLNTDRHFAPAPRAPSAREGEDLRATLLRLGLTLRGVLAHGGLTVRELLELEPGHIIPLGKGVTEPATLDLEGVPRFTARTGNVNGRRALRVLSVISKGEHS